MKHKPQFLFCFFVGALISGYYLASFAKGLEGTLGGLRPHLGWVLAALVLHLLSHGLRARKSRLLVEVIKPTGEATLFKGLALGYLFNSVLPFRLGELARAHFIGKRLAISRTAVFCTILIERLVDGAFLSLAALLCVALARAGILPRSSLLDQVSFLVVGTTATIGVVLALFYSQNRRLLLGIHRATGLFNDSIRDRARFVLWSLIYGLNFVLSRAKLTHYLVLSALMWGGYLGSVALLVRACFPLALLTERFATAVGAFLSVLVPSGPAYLGTFHYFFSKMAGELLPASSSLPLFSVQVWALLILPVSLLGLVFLLKERAEESQLGDADPLFSKLNKLHRQSDISLELRRMLDAYFSSAGVARLLSKKEMLGDFRLIEFFRGGSHATTVLAWSDQRLLVKKITPHQFSAKLRQQYIWLNERQSLPHIPRLLGEETEAGAYSFDMEYRPGLQPFFDFIHSRSVSESSAVLGKILGFAREHIYHPQPSRTSTLLGASVLESYIDSKIVGKVKDCATLDNGIAQLLAHPRIKVNGVWQDNLLQVVEKIRQQSLAMAELSVFDETPIHGDLTIDNILVSPEDFLLLDPNDENQISDSVVDMAKLYQSLHSGYEFLCVLPEVSAEGDEITFQENISTKYGDLFKHLDGRLRAELTEARYRSILFHEAVHYCRMLTYRAKLSSKTLPAFYGTAVRLFNQYLNQFARV